MYPEKVNEAWQNYYREHGLSWLAPQVVASIREAFFAGMEVAEQSLHQTALPCDIEAHDQAIEFYNLMESC
jgi:hypothetical protein